MREGVAEREHRAGVADLGERAATGRADALRRRVGRDQRRERGLEGHELAQQLVVLGVGELGRVLLVVEAVRAVERLGQLGMAGRGRVRLEGRGGLDEGSVDGELVDGLGHRCQGYGGGGTPAMPHDPPMPIPRLETERLILRGFNAADRAPFASASMPTSRS